MGHDTTHWEGMGKIIPQGGPQDYGEATTEKTVWSTGLSLSIRYDGGDRIAGGGKLSLILIENSRTVYCNQAHYGPVYGGGAEAGVKGGQVVVLAGQNGFGGDEDGGSGGGTERGGDGRPLR